MYIYLDESGDFKGKQTKYFIIASYVTNNPKGINNAYRRWQITKLPQKFKWLPEIKFSNTKLTDELRLKTLDYLMQQDIRIFYTYLLSKNIPIEYRKKRKIIKTGLLYTQIVANTLELYLPTTAKGFRVFMDKRKLKGLKTKEFRELLKTRIIPKLPKGGVCQIETLDSSQSVIQVADWICGALARYHEEKARGEDFYAVLKNNIVKSQELFKQYWGKKWSPTRKTRGAEP